jgi:hypothetical protein
VKEHRQPVLLVWDYDRQEYVIGVTRVCMALWASASSGHAKGDVCGEEPAHRVGDVPVCQHHYDRAEEWAWKVARDEHIAVERERDELEEERARWGTVLARREKRRREIAAHARAREREAASLVYYIRRVSDGMVKIGFSSAISTRLSDLEREHGELQLLHTSPGGRAEEDALHDQFSAWHCEGEWFHPGRPLMNWIRSERVRTRPARVRGTVSLGVLAEVSKGAPSKPLPARYVPRRTRPRYVVAR